MHVGADVTTSSSFHSLTHKNKRFYICVCLCVKKYL